MFEKVKNGFNFWLDITIVIIVFIGWLIIWIFGLLWFLPRALTGLSSYWSKSFSEELERS